MTNYEKSIAIWNKAMDCNPFFDEDGSIFCGFRLRGSLCLAIMVPYDKKSFIVGIIELSNPQNNGLDRIRKEEAFDTFCKDIEAVAKTEARWLSEEKTKELVRTFTSAKAN